LSSTLRSDVGARVAISGRVVGTGSLHTTAEAAMFRIVACRPHAVPVPLKDKARSAVVLDTRSVRATVGQTFRANPIEGQLVPSGAQTFYTVLASQEIEQ